MDKQHEKVNQSMHDLQVAAKQRDFKGRAFTIMCMIMGRTSGPMSKMEMHAAAEMSMQGVDAFDEEAEQWIQENWERYAARLNS